MHPRETPKAFENVDSFHFIGWFVPVGSEPTLALKTMMSNREVVWFPKFMTMLRKDAIDVTRYVLVAADGEKMKKPVQLTRPKFPCCEVPTLSAKRTAQMASWKDRSMKSLQWSHRAHLVRWPRP